jgi:multidrug efflux pump subunit AcrA (membrane-fusion protein)
MRPSDGVYPARLQAEPGAIKTGISDGIFTEVLDGLQEGDRVVTAMTGKAPSAAQQSNNPLAGGQRRF